MSTTPTEILQTTAAAVETTLAATEAAIAETTAADAIDIASIKALMDGFDPASLLPDLSELFGSLPGVCRFAVMIGPLILLVLGLCYLFLAPKEANYYFGYRCYFGMGSIYAWRSTQRLAGLLFTGVGLVLTVIVFVVSGRFAYMDVTDMVWQALDCAIAEAAAALLVTLTVNITTALRFNRKGEHRRKNKRT